MDKEHTKGGRHIHTIYLDVLIVTDLYMNFLLLRLTARFTHTPLSTGRALAAAAAGCVTCLTVLRPPPGWTMLPLQIAGAVLLCAAAFGVRPVRRLAVQVVWLFGMSMLLAGALLAMAAAGLTRVVYAGGRWYPDLSLVQLIGGTIAAYLALQLWDRIRQRGHAEDVPTQIVIQKDGRTVLLDGICDTGNVLTDLFTGLPVVVCPREALAEMLPDEMPAKGFRPLPFETVSGSGMLWAFRPDQIAVVQNGHTRRIDALVGVTDRPGRAAVFHPRLLR